MKKTLTAALVMASVLVATNASAQGWKDKLKNKVNAASSKPAATSTAQPASAGAKSGKATYHLLEAERSPKGGTTKTIILEEGELNGQKMLVIAACQSGCTPATYSWQAEPSSTLGIKVYFNSAGLYVMQYDDNSWVSVMPDKQLGVHEFTKFMFSNFYSTDAAKVKGMTKAKAEAYAKEMSKKILAPSNAGPSKGGNGTYHLAVPTSHANKKVETYEVHYEDGAVKKIETGHETFMFMPEFSKLIGKDMYSNTRSHLQEYIIVDAPGIIIWAKYKAGGLGKQEWRDNDHFNMFAMDKQVVRGLVANDDQQKALNDKLIKWSSTIKAAEDKRRASETKDKIDSQRLPKEGLNDAKLKAQALEAAKAWATKWNWKETVTKAYFTGADWVIVNHWKTGAILRREIRGVIVMNRPDGMCSFHYCVFGQQYNGSGYNKVYTSGITPGQYKLHCEHAK